MRELGFFFGNYLLFLAATLLLAGLECSLWLQVFGDSPGPNLWVPTLVYWTLTREATESVPMIYLLTILLAGLTALSLPVFLVINMTLFSLLYLIKQRIYTSGPVYFMLIAGVAAFSVLPLHALFSWTFEENSLTHPSWFKWVLEPLITMLAALPLYQVFAFLDVVTHKERPAKMETTHHE